MGVNKTSVLVYSESFVSVFIILQQLNKMPRPKKWCSKRGSTGNKHTKGRLVTIVTSEIRANLSPRSASGKKLSGSFEQFEEDLGENNVQDVLRSKKMKRQGKLCSERTMWNEQATTTLGCDASRRRCVGYICK